MTWSLGEFDKFTELKEKHMHSWTMTFTTLSKPWHILFLVFHLPLAKADGSGYVVTLPPGAKANSSYSEMANLVDNLLHGYDKRLRPRFWQGNPVKVDTSFIPLAIINLDVQKQTMLINGYFVVSWIDEKIKWNQHDYSGTNVVRIPLNNIWHPQLVLRQTYDSSVIGNYIMDIAQISHVGEVSWVPNGLYSFLCEVDLERYPFDTQSCSMQYYVSDETQETVTLDVKPVNTTEYTENSEWSLRDVTSGKTTQHSADIARITFKIERRPQFTVYTMILPVATLGTINVFSFLLPIESGEKAGLSVTVFLTYAFFIIIVRDGLPHNSIKMSYYVIYLCCTLILSVVNVIYVIIESKLYFTYGDQKVSFFTNLGKRMKKKRKIKSDVEIRRRTSYIPGDRSSDDSNCLKWPEFLRIVDILAFVLSLLYMLSMSIASAVRLKMF